MFLLALQRLCFHKNVRHANEPIILCIDVILMSRYLNVACVLIAGPPCAPHAAALWTWCEANTSVFQIRLETPEGNDTDILIFCFIVCCAFCPSLLGT